MLELVKMALRISGDAYDEQLTMLIEAAAKDLKLATGIVEDTTDALVQNAVCTYCLLHMGVPEDFDRIKRSYDEQKAQLSTATGYTNWMEA